MTDLERAKLIPVSGNNDTPDLNNAIDVQFNPVSLKVNLANTLKPPQGQGSSRATQFVDKSSSSLAVELVFDTSYIPAGSSAETAQGGGTRNRIEQGSDVRQQTRKIAEKFMKPVEAGGRMQAPSRVLFQWGAFEFVGIVQSYDETLDFFSPKGRPLRATVALKLNEDRYQFRSNDSDALAAENGPRLSFTGAGRGATPDDPGAPTPAQGARPVPGSSQDGTGSWRENALFNGVETPRAPEIPLLALPGIHLGDGLSLGGSTSLTIAGGNSSRSTSTAGAATPPAGEGVTPPFRFGQSSQLGTGIPGAFPLQPGQPGGPPTAAQLQQGSQRLRPASSETRPETPGSPATRTGPAGLAAGSSTPAEATGSTRPLSRRGPTVSARLNRNPDPGVGFD